MPPQDDETNDSLTSLPEYSGEDLDILHEIIALASSIPSSQPFRSIWRAYDTVLAARKIDPALDRVYFRFVLQLQGAPGNDLKEKFIYILDKLGVDVDGTRYTDFTGGVPEEITQEYNRSRFEEAKGRRERVRQSASSAEEEGYRAEDESQPRTDPRGTMQKVTQVEVRPSRRARTLRDPRDDALKAANDAAHKRRLEVRERRAAMSSSDTEQLSEDSSRSELKDVANRFHRDAILRKCFHHWKDRTVQLVEKRWFAVLERRAGRRYDLVLLAKTWDIWVRQTAVIVQRTHEVRQRILARKYFNAWKEFVQANRKKVLHFQLSCALHRWISAFNKRQDIEQQAAEVYHGNLAHRVYWQWYFKHLNIAVPQRYSERLVHTALYQWGEKMDRVMELRTKADEFLRRKTLQKIFSHWVHRTDSSLEQQDDAVNYLDWRRRQTVFDKWRRQAILAPLVKGMQDVVNDRIVYERFTAWKVRTKNEIAAAEMYKQNLIRKTFRTWRLTLRHHIMAEHHDRLLQRNILQQWTCQERLQLLARTHNRKLVRRAIQLFAEKCREKSSKLRRAYRQVALNYRRNLAKRIFHWWYEKSQYNAKLLHLQSNAYQATLIGKALSSWRDRLGVIKVQEDQAAHALYYFTAKRALARWNAAVNESKKNRLRQAYQTFSRNRKRRTAQLFFGHWRDRVYGIWIKQQTAERKFEASVHHVGRRVLFNWFHKTLKIAENDAEAEAFARRRLLGAALDVWIESHQNLRALDDHADTRLREHNLTLISKYLDRWDKKFWRISRRTEEGLQWLARNETKRAQSLFRLWREKASQRQQLRETTDIQQFVDTTIIIPLRDGAVTPPRGLKTPGWKTTGGHRRRGILGNRSLVATTPMGSPGSPLKRYGMFGKSMLGRVVEPEDEDEGTLVGSQALTVGSQSTTGGM
ncbi:Sfi1-domain-containing protein [Wilcoxina mikolae CBS 423.85]|nr:Sfi1-domain-containing protein [Wilcoxina mikolae CBS 423.85]